MTKGKRELFRFISDCLHAGQSYDKIEESLINHGYSRRVAEGIILSYKYRGNLVKWFVVFFLSSLFVGSVYLGGSGIIGLVTLGYAEKFSETPGIIINESSNFTWHPIHQGEIVSITVTGNILGEGDAEISILNSERKILMLDSAKNPIDELKSSVLNQKIRHFESACIESCNLFGLNKSAYNIEVLIDHGTVEIEKISYLVKASKDVEQIPNFIEIPKLNGNQININLRSFFNTSSENVIFGSISSDPLLSISIKEDVAGIFCNTTGIYHAYFTAKQDGIEYMSNLVDIEITDPYEKEEIIYFNFSGNQLSGKTNQAEQFSPKNKMFGIFLLAVAFCIIIILAITPAYYFDIHRVANKYEKLRETKGISNAINELEIKKKKLQGSFNMAEREQLIDELESTLDGLNEKILANHPLKEFNRLCMEFEKENTKEKAEKIYIELRKSYLKALKHKVHPKEKKEMYDKIERYYKRLKKF